MENTADRCCFSPWLVGEKMTRKNLRSRKKKKTKREESTDRQTTVLGNLGSFFSQAAVDSSSKAKTFSP